MAPGHDSSALDEQRLRELIDVGRSLVAEQDPGVVFRRLPEIACNLTDARYGALSVLDENRGGLERFVTHGIDADTKRAIGDLPRGLGVLGMLIDEPRPLRLSDVGQHPRSCGFPAAHPSMKSFLAVPVMIRGRAWGSLYLSEKRDGEFDEADEESVIILAEWVAIAVATAQSVAEDRTRDRIAATERERGRWARELHDESLQSLAGLRVVLSAARRSDARALDRLLELGIEQVDLTIAEMRRLIADLRPTALDELGLGAAIETLSERLALGDVIDVETDVDLDCPAGHPGQRLVPEIEDTAYRLVQEALNNAARHGGAKHARVEVSEQGETLRIRVSDDGRGFDPGARSDGYGLVSMRERIALAGGSLELRSSPGDGTTIVALLPARHRAEGDGEASGSSHSSPTEPEKEPAGGS